MEEVGIFFGHLEYLTAINIVQFLAIWYFSGHLVYFPRFGIMCQEKSGNPDLTMDYYVFFGQSFISCSFQ
jgi:hypothetical protein